MRFQTLFSLFLIFSASTFAPGVVADPTADALLQRSHQAMGGVNWDGIETMLTRYSVKTSGLEGTAVSVEDLQTGRTFEGLEIVDPFA